MGVPGEEEGEGRRKGRRGMRYVSVWLGSMNTQTHPCTLVPLLLLHTCVFHLLGGIGDEGCRVDGDYRFC